MQYISLNLETNKEEWRIRETISKLIISIGADNIHFFFFYFFSVWSRPLLRNGLIRCKIVYGVWPIFSPALTNLWIRIDLEFPVYSTKQFLLALWLIKLRCTYCLPNGNDDNKQKRFVIAFSSVHRSNIALHLSYSINWYIFR